MKYSIFILATLVLVEFSCNKKTNSNESSTADSSTSYQTIFYKHYNPDTLILPYKNEFYLDVNNDSINDLRFFLFHYTESFGGNVWDCYLLGIGSEDSLRFITKQGSYTLCSIPLDSNMSISDQDKLIIQIDIANSCEVCCYFDKKKYVGFILRKDNMKYYGWIKFCKTPDYDAVLIEEFATLKTTTGYIKAGWH